jgi:hypothetical protein
VSKTKAIKFLLTGELIGSEDELAIEFLNVVLPDETFTENRLEFAKNSPKEPSCYSRGTRLSTAWQGLESCRSDDLGIANFFPDSSFRGSKRRNCNNF